MPKPYSPLGRTSHLRKGIKLLHQRFQVCASPTLLTEGSALPVSTALSRGRSLFSPGPSHVSLQLLQQALPVPDIKVGSSCPDLALDALVQHLQLVVRLPLEHGLHI